MEFTQAEINQRIYKRYQNEGLSHGQIMRRIPNKFRKQFANDIGKTSIHAHFGIPDKYFYLIVGVFISAVTLLALYFG